MKGLFITHDVSDYGASRSLQLLLRNMEDMEIDMVISPNSLPHDLIRCKFGGHVANIYERILPWDTCYKWRDGQNQRGSVLSCRGRNGIRGKLAQLALLTREWKHLPMLCALIAKKKYDFVHLNSLVLHPLVKGRFPFIIHVREIYDGSNDRVFTSLEKARGVIFIDEATHRPFKQASLRNRVVLNNPFDMTAIGGYSDSDIHVGFDHRKNTVFSIIGQLTEFKGTAFLIKVFSKLQNPNVRLLIVGDCSTPFGEHCRSLANDRRIIFWGHEPDILKIYRISDYIVRAEPEQCIGRTVFEGLYGGCHVVVPGEREYLEYSNELGTFGKALHYYPPRHTKFLIKLLEELALTKVMAKKGGSNVSEAVERFRLFLASAL